MDFVTINLNRSRVAYEGGRHLEASGRDVAHRSLDIVRNPEQSFQMTHDKESSPFHEVGTILVLDAQHLFVHLLNKVIHNQHQTPHHNRKKKRKIS